MDASPRIFTVAAALLTLASTHALGAQDPPAAQNPPPAQGPAAARAPASTQAPAAAQDPAAAQNPAEAKAASTFTPEQLEQIVAPIALHPDSLLSMILMASTYPLEIVEAARWAQKNSSLKGKALEDALKQQDWDPSVKSICGFPTVLKQMNENLDWTQDLGDAFLGQKKELMDTVQKMRRKALDAGNLKSTEQQKVTDEDKIIVIQSTSPEVIYVPSYPPTVVYGSAWYYPTYYYPPMYAPYPPGAALFTFGMGVAWGAAVWGNCNWGGSDVDIDINKQNNFNNRTEINPNRSRNDKAGGGRESFKHDPAHRKGANYKNPQTAQKYGAAPGTNRVTNDQARGRAQGSGGAAAKGGNRAATTPSTGNAGSRPSGGSGASAKAGNQRPAQTPSRSAQTPSAKTRSGGSGGGGSSALSGSRSPGMDRSASTRGAASRGGGGGGGGGRSRGGGGGRRR